MDPAQTAFTIPEAAAITGLDVRSVNKAIENGIVRAETSAARRRSLPLAELVCLQLEHDLSPALTLSARRALIREIARRPRAETVSAGDLLVVRVGASRKRLAERLKRLKLARRMVTTDPRVMGGEPVIAGTRIPVHTIAALVEAGTPPEDIVAGYPGLTAETIELAVIYATATPRRGRPRKQPWQEAPPTRSLRVALPD